MINDIFSAKEAIIENIIDNAEENGWDYHKKPNYKTPTGCPKIDIEVISPESRIFYVILNGPKGFSDESAKQLIRAINIQVEATGDNRTIELYIDCLRTKINQLPPECKKAAIKYETQQ